MAEVSLRRVTDEIFASVVALQVTEAQANWIASNLMSLAQDAIDPALTSFAVFDGRERGMVEPSSGPVGFAQIELRAGVGFIQRMMIDRAHQGKGYGRALILELIRRLRLEPDAEMIATSHRLDNVAMARLTSAVGFVPWEVPWAAGDPEEHFLILAE